MSGQARRVGVVLALTGLLVSATGWLLPVAASAHGRRGGGAGLHKAGSFVVAGPRHGVGQQKSAFAHQPVNRNWRTWPQRALGQRHRVVEPVAPGFVAPFVGGTSVVGVPFVGSSVYGDAADYAVAPAAYAVAALPPPAPPAHPPLPTLVEYATGWYQLRGDGIMTPYVWTWIPKPPPAPPEPAEPLRSTPPPRPAPPASEPARGPEPPAYRWTDDSGVTTWTNRLERVPKRYRDQAIADAESR